MTIDTAAEAPDPLRFFTQEMADRANAAILADRVRRLAKLRRLMPDAPPYFNLYAPMLDAEDGDPELDPAS